MSNKFTESIVEEATLEWFEELGYVIALPTDALEMAFDETISPSLESLASNIHESRSLTAARDKLLPKLANGNFAALAAVLGKSTSFRLGERQSYLTAIDWPRVQDWFKLLDRRTARLCQRF